jgi:hypothetical protein
MTCSGIQEINNIHTKLRRLRDSPPRRSVVQRTKQPSMRSPTFLETRAMDIKMSDGERDPSAHCVSFEKCWQQQEKKRCFGLELG